MTAQAIVAEGLMQPRPVVLVERSYGGSVISQAGADSKVVSLVYVAAQLP
jgi:hypothetical protein